ncbi:PdaC/SigV domain-containing protein [Pelotomaculum propionicicum]|uniref:PdaC/SigV domain-containing protein n=1 Tax=Pelotomaculum propionicicum TaxID=258475 RepID=UPI003B803B6A
MMRRLFLAGTIISLILSIPGYGFAAADSQPAIALDGAKIEAAAYIDRGNVYLPLRAVGEALGYEIQWWGKDNTISVTGPGENIVIDLNNNKITANDHVSYMGGDYTNIKDSTYMGADFFSANFGLEVRWDRQNGMVQLERVTENSISIKTIKEASETDIIKITLQYPQVEGLTDKTVQDSINSILKESAMEARNEGLKNADEKEKANASGYGSPNKYETYFDYSLKYNQNGLLSVVFRNYQYTGGAHGLTVQSSRTLDLKTGGEYKLKDLMKVDADYVALISDTVRNMIVERVEEGILPDYSIAPFNTIRDDHGFYLSNNGVVVYFQQYEHWPYAAGIQEFPVEYSALKDMLKPEFSF